MPDIDWTDKDFRLAVAHKLAGQIHIASNLIGCLAAGAPSSLDVRRANIEAALGCTLKEIQEDMERRVAP